MRRLRSTVAVLLLASLISNALLLARRSSPPVPDRVAAAEAPERGPAPAQVKKLQERNELLKKKIRDLASSSPQPRPAGPAAPGDADAPSFRERLRRYFQLMQDENPRENEESALAISETYLEFLRASVERTKNPAAYDACLRDLFEALLQDEKLKLTADQSKEFGRILEGYRQAALKVRENSIPDQSLAELEIEASAMNRAKALMSPEQYQRTTRLLGGMGFFVESLWYWGIISQGAEQGLASAWTQAYKLDESQQVAAEEAARPFAELLRQIEREQRGTPGTQFAKGAGYEFRIRAQQSQIDALKRLEHVMSPEQKERFRGKQLIEFNIQVPQENSK